ncbi:MAG: CAP domain-containing protein, partial [Nitriliruptoraceae bacterium]
MTSTSAHRPRPRTRFVALITVLATLLGGTAAAADEPERRSDAEADVELHVAELHADARSDPGAFGYPGQEAAPQLTWSEEVARAARGWSDELAADGELAHNVGWVEEQGSAGENVQYLYVRTDRAGWRREAAERLVQGWMDSDDHRDVLLHDAFDEFGVGVTITEAEGSLVKVYSSVPFRAGDGDLERPVDLLRVRRAGRVGEPLL